jgi:hypothetical protein
MTEKNQQEKNAAQRQVDLLTNAFEMAKENGGVWLNKDSKQAPKFYQKGMAISPFNAIILGLHSDQNNYKTSEYTLFTEARKRGESVLSGQKAYHSTGITGTNIRARKTQITRSVVRNTKHLLQSSRPSIRVFAAVRFVSCSISNRPPSLWLTRMLLTRK